MLTGPRERKGDKSKHKQKTHFSDQVRLKGIYLETTALVFENQTTFKSLESEMSSPIAKTNQCTKSQYAQNRKPED